MDLSIIIPVYNAEKYLSKSLNSIFNQINSNLSYEVIAVNDGSKDGSNLILREYAKKYSNLRIINQENKGAGTARNMGIENSLGKYLWFIDSDDFIELNSFSILKEYIYAGVHTISFDYYRVNSLGVKTHQINCNSDKYLLSGLEYLEATKFSSLWKNIYKSEIIKNNNLRFIDGIKNIEDFEFNLRYFRFENAVKLLKTPLYNYFENELSTSRNQSRDNIIKLSLDTIQVHKSISFLLDSIKADNQKESFAVIQNELNKSILGFFFSLLRYPYTFNDVLNYYNLYLKIKLLPAYTKGSNYKFRLFEKFVNNKFLYLTAIYLKKKLIK